MASDYLTTPQLIQRWGVAESTIENARSLGKGPKFIRANRAQATAHGVRAGSILYLLADVIAYEEKPRKGTTWWV